jgi:hypothetical protein
VKSKTTLGLIMLMGVLPAGAADRQMEYLGHGVVAVNQGDGRVYIGWCLLGTDPENIAFNVYRVAEGGVPVTLMHGPVYRLGVAWQNVAYNQPAHPGFYLGEGMAAGPRPAIRTIRLGSDYRQPPI